LRCSPGEAACHFPGVEKILEFLIVLANDRFLRRFFFFHDIIIKAVAIVVNNVVRIKEGSWEVGKLGKGNCLNRDLQDKRMHRMMRAIHKRFKQALKGLKGLR